MADAEARVTKSLFLSAFVCPTRGGYSRTVEPTVPTAGEQFRMREGQEIGQRARQLFVNGVFAGDVGKTAELLATTDVLFEASFEIDGYIARTDILQQRDRGVSLLEIKSSLHNDGKVKPEHIDDMAYTTMVLTFIRRARHARHALAHAGGRETEDLRRASHNFTVHDGVIHIMPDDVKALYSTLKDAAFLLAEIANRRPEFRSELSAGA